MSGTADIQIRINKKTGTYEVTVLGHGDGASCSLEMDHDLITKIAQSMGSVTDEDNTEEYYEEMYGGSSVSKHQGNKECVEGKKKEDKISLGYGV